MITFEQKLENKRKAGLARAKQFTRQSQQHARSFRSRESLVASGKMAFQVALQRGKIPSVQQRISTRNIKHASSNHVAVRNWLRTHGYNFAECVFPFADSMHEVDFIIGCLAIEVDGFRFRKNAFGDEQRDRKKELQSKLRKLHNHRYKVIVLDARKLPEEIARLERWLEKNKVFPKPRQVLSDTNPLPF